MEMLEHVPDPAAIVRACATLVKPGGHVFFSTLNRNPKNIFQETEQSAFAPSNMVPGIEPSEDRMLQGRLFSYADTQMYRIGANALQLPINAPLASVASNNQDGALNSGKRTGSVNYEPSRQQALSEDPAYKFSKLALSGTTQQQRIAKTANFGQAGDFYRSLSASEKTNLISNMAGDLGQVTDDTVRYTMLSHFYKADADYGKALAMALKADAVRVAKMAATLKD